MSDEADLNADKQPDVPAEQNEEVNEDQEQEIKDDSDQKDDQKADADEEDIVSKALKENEALKQQLESLKNNQDDVFLQNEALKAELEQQEKLAKIAKENEELRLQLEGVKRNSMIDNLVARGSIPNELREWAGKLEFKMLEEFMKFAPKPKTILHQKNGDGLSEPTKVMEDWKKEQSKSRIISN